MPLRLTRVWLLLLAAGSATLLASTASHLYRKGRKAERGGHIAQAFLFYSEAAAADPRNPRYRERAEALASMAALEAKVNPPDLLASAEAAATGPRSSDLAPDLAPEAVFDSLAARDLASDGKMLPPRRLALKPGIANYALDGDYKTIFQKMAEQLGFQVIFDNDFDPGHPIRFRLNEATPREVLHGLEAATNSFVVPLGPRLMMVAQDTEAKRKELEQVEVVSIPVPSALTTQEITEIGQAVKQTVGIDKIYWDPTANQIVLRDRVTRAETAQSIVRDLVSYRSKVAIDLQFIELNQTQMLQIGVDIATSFPISFLTGGGATITLSQLAKFSVGQLFGVGISNIDITAVMSDAGARNLLNTTLYSVEGQKATLHVGSKYPIITSQYLGGNSGGYTPAPSFTFEDLGLVINVTPHAHGMGEISMELDTEFKVLGALQQVGIPIISNRKLQTTVRLKNNQWALVAGLTTENVTRTKSGPPILSRIPFLGNLVSTYTRNKTKDYIILALRPRLLSTPPDQIVTHRVSLGSEMKTTTPL